MSTGALHTEGRRDAVAAWVALTAPGALVSCAIVTLALLAVPAVTPLVVVSRAVQQAAAGLLLAHMGVTAILELKPGGWWTALLFLGLLGLEALLCGVLLAGSRDQLAPLLACTVLVISLEVGGWFAAGMATVATALGAAAAAWWGGTVAVFVHAAVSFPTTLDVDTSFAGAAVMTAPASPFATTLSVETWVAGGPAFASAEELFMPALAVVLVALCLGLATSVWRVRKARAAVAASIVAAARVTV